MTKKGNAHRRPKIRRRTGHCFYCKRQFEPTPLRKQTRDHVVPRSQGGPNHKSNIVACCWECNNRKGDMPADEFIRMLEAERQATNPVT